MEHSLSVFALAAILVGLGCSGSHAPEDAGDGGRTRRDTGDMCVCCGGAPGCVEVMPVGGPYCCGEARRPAECGDDGVWRCPSGFTPTTACTGYWATDMCGMAPAPDCTEPSGCVLRPASCCGDCGAPTPDDMIALPTAGVDEYVTMVCAGVPCPECARPFDPYLIATCSAEDRCTAIDLHVDPLTECAAPSDCVLEPVECCSCGSLGPTDVVAYNPMRGSLSALLCDSDLPPCPPCVPDFGTMTASCEAGRCVVVP